MGFTLHMQGVASKCWDAELSLLQEPEPVCCKRLGTLCSKHLAHAPTPHLKASVYCVRVLPAVLGQGLVGGDACIHALLQILVAAVGDEQQHDKKQSWELQFLMV